MKRKINVYKHKQAYNNGQSISMAKNFHMSPNALTWVLGPTSANVPISNLIDMIHEKTN